MIFGDVTPLTGSLGAEVAKADLRSVAHSGDARSELRRLLDQYHIVGFRNQHLDDDEHQALASVFGTPQVHVIEQARGASRTIEEIADSPDRLPDRDGWHTDAPFLQSPPSVALLRSLKVPAAGGDTLFANMHAAYETLSPAMQDYLGRLTVHYPAMSGLVDYAARKHGAEVAERVRELAGDGGRHPIVRQHPVTGRKTIYFAEGFAGSIIGLPKHENAMMLAFLASLPNNPNFQCRWRWAEGDVVIWDEVSTQHFGAADHSGSTRIMRRVLAR